MRVISQLPVRATLALALLAGAASVGTPAKAATTIFDVSFSISDGTTTSDAVFTTQNQGGGVRAICAWT